MLTGINADLVCCFGLEGEVAGERSIAGRVPDVGEDSAERGAGGHGCVEGDDDCLVAGGSAVEWVLVEV